MGLIDGESVPGKDVDGTIDGFQATGRGQLLVGTEETPTEGLRVFVNLDEKELLPEQEEARVKLTKGEPGGFTGESDRGRPNLRRFCRDCGTRGWAELERGVASVNGMALDDKSHIKPTHNHRLETAPDWCLMNEALHTLPVTP